MILRERLQKIFTEMHQDRIICEPDLVSVIRKTDNDYPGQGFGSFYNALKRVDPVARPADTATILARYQSVFVHALMAPFTMRMTELLGSIPDERSRVDHVIEMLEAYVKNPAHSGIRHYAVCTTAEAFNYLVFRQSSHIEYLADSIIAKVKSNPSLVRALLCPSETSEKADDKVMLDQLRASIERQGELAHWIKKNIPSRSRPQMNVFTQWPEVMQAMTKASRGKALEDDLGL
ncbi:hypothetical protein [Pseudomonas putida]|uniref:Uncharacterized protein n=1 Tax=Pseudomonas putida TaxID=303 RepID=A0A8I1JGD4_PSEPU|nr:hypothetical protein [Pseudomonas putida]MBI6882697.1 hypothetical protein [Pseudomonas putida]